MSEQGIQRKGRLVSTLTGYASEPPPRLTNKERDEFRRKANAASKRIDQRMASRVKFYPATINNGPKRAVQDAPYYSAASAGAGTPVSHC